jgi:hypothetical protein
MRTHLIADLGIVNYDCAEPSVTLRRAVFCNQSCAAWGGGGASTRGSAEPSLTLSRGRCVRWLFRHWETARSTRKRYAQHYVAGGGVLFECGEQRAGGSESENVNRCVVEDPIQCRICHVGSSSEVRRCNGCSWPERTTGRQDDALQERGPTAVAGRTSIGTPRRAATTREKVGEGRDARRSRASPDQRGTGHPPPA